MKKRILSLILAAVLLLTFLPVSALAADTPFTDVPADSYFAEPVSWAAKNEITQGVSATEFGALKSCDRATVLTFLWRAADCPEPTATTCPYTDVELDSWYGKAVLWAVEKGITNGISADKFGTQQPCNRATVVTFLWRAAGRPEPTATTCPYTDVELDSWYGKPVLWAVEKGITQGISADKFGTLQTCNRAAVVTFLYRDEMSTPTPDPEAPKSLANKVYGEDYTDLYGRCGYYTTIDQVVEDPETGMAMLMVDGELRYLGMDFLSMAMVYNTAVPAGGKWQTEDDVCATWWRYYMTRWNYLMPEIPLYSNQYFDLYNTQITGVQENPTNPYWSAPQALIDWGSTKADNSIILGSGTAMSGRFRYTTFDKGSSNAADVDIQQLTSGLDTRTSSKDGKFVWNSTVVKSHTQTINSDGSQTITIQLHDDLKFSDGSKITAKNYLVAALAFSTPVAVQAAGRDLRAGSAFIGYTTFSAYDGGNTDKHFSGLRLIDELTFSATTDSNYILSFTPAPTALWLGDADIVDDGLGVYITDDFYAKEGDTFLMAEHIRNSALGDSSAYPWSGPYTLESFDADENRAVLIRNPYFKGNYQGSKPSIEKVIYCYSYDDPDSLLDGTVDIVCGITGGEETQRAIDLANASNGKIDYISYDRAGYGKLAFRSDFGPAQFTEVRQAIAYCMDRPAFANDFTGGYGTVVDGAYYPGFWAYQQSLKEGMKLNPYTTSLDKAIALLEEGGWVYNAEGGAYTGGVRYKKIPAAEMLPKDIAYASLDGAYTTTKVGDFYYLPLVLNWFGTAPNDVTDMLIPAFMENENINAAGFAVQCTQGNFNAMNDALYQSDGTAVYSCFNFASAFNNTAYDFSYNWTIDPGLFEYYSAHFLKDMADVYWLK